MDRIHAQRIIGLLNLEPGKHRVLEANLDSFLQSAPPLPEGALANREALNEWLFKTGASLMGRAEEGEPGLREMSRTFEKLRRDIKRPYDDQAVGEHITRLESDFAAWKTAAADYPREYIAFGSAVSTGFGAHSDLDFFFSGPQEIKKPIAHGGAVGYGRSAEQFAGLVAELGQAPDLRRLGSARELILGRLQERGVRLAEDAHGWTATRFERQPIQPEGARAVEQQPAQQLAQRE